MTSRWSDLDRPPLSQPRLARAVIGGTWTHVRIVESTTSTNADVVAALESGDGEGLVVLAEEQTSGRGRLSRQWSAPARSSLLLSAGLRPTPPEHRWSLLSLIAGAAAVEALQSVAQLDARLKWPNDVIVEDRKLGGILLERTSNGVAVGIGLNVTMREAERPVPQATSVLIEGGVIDRQPLAAELLRSLDRRYQRWCAMGGDSDAVLPEYRAICATIGSSVRLDLPDSESVTGVAVDIDDLGRVLLATDGAEPVAWSAGDVTHLRSTD